MQIENGITLGSDSLDDAYSCPSSCELSVWSSILASLLEAGGNDPLDLVTAPLPPHSLNGADRVGTQPISHLAQVNGPSIRPSAPELSITWDVGAEVIPFPAYFGKYCPALVSPNFSAFKSLPHLSPRLIIHSIRAAR